MEAQTLRGYELTAQDLYQLLADGDEDYDQSADTTGDDGTESSFGDSNTSVVARAKSPRKRIEIPRLFKNDIRRSYSFMYANVLSSLDVDWMASFLNKFFVFDFKSTYELLPRGGEKPQETVGYAEFINTWYIGSIASPDIIYTMNDSRVIANADDSSIVMCNFNVDATKLYETPPPVNLENAQEYIDGCTSFKVGQKRRMLTPPEEPQGKIQSIATTSGRRRHNVKGGKRIRACVNRAALDPDSTNYLDDIQSTTITSFLPRPYKVTLAGTLKMHVDANKRITAMEFVATPRIARVDMNNIL